MPSSFPTESPISTNPTIIPSSDIPTDSPSYFPSTWIPTVIPTKQPTNVTNVIKTNGTTNMSFTLYNLAVILGTVAGILIICCSILAAYYFYWKRKRAREDEMLKWSETNDENIQVFKKYEVNDENPAFGQGGVRGRGLSIVSRAIDAVKRFSVRGSLKLHHGNENGEVLHSKSARQAQGSSSNRNAQSVFDSTKYIASTK